MQMTLSVLQPALFENIVMEVVQHLQEVVVQTKPGEAEVLLSLVGGGVL